MNRTLVKLNKTEHVLITKHGEVTACSLIMEGEPTNLAALVTKASDHKPVEGIGKVARATVEAVNRATTIIKKIKSPLKAKNEKELSEKMEIFAKKLNNLVLAGDKVLYDGKKYTATRTYEYKGKLFAILDKKKQVAQSKLTKTR